MIFDYRTQYLTSFREVVSSFVTPIQYVANWPIDLANLLGKSFTTKKELSVENAELRASQLLLQAKVQKYDFLLKENQNLKTILGLTNQFTEKVMPAELMPINANAAVQEMGLNKGKKDGVYVGQPIIDPSGLIGRIVATGLISSRVMLITDIKSAIPAINVRTGKHYIAVGVGAANYLELANVTDTEDLKEGDVLVTSSLGLHLADGYPIGMVNSVKHVVGERFAKVIVLPKAQIGSSTYVLALWPEFSEHVKSMWQDLEKSGAGLSSKTTKEKDNKAKSKSKKDKKQKLS